MTVLVLSPRFSEDSIAISKAAIRAGWNVERLPSWHIPPLLAEEDCCVYAEPLFAINAASQLDLHLIEPSYDWLLTLPHEYVRREVRLLTMAEARGLPDRWFVKSAGEKFFRAGVFESASQLPSSEIVPDAFPVLACEPVQWDVEFRLFVSEGKCLTMSPYMRAGELARDDSGAWSIEQSIADEATSFATGFLSNGRPIIPPSVVIDIGVIRGRGWAVVEANAVWGSGIYGCDAREILPAIRRACVKSHRLTDADRPWVIDHQSEDFT